MTDRQERVESLRDEHGNLFDVIAEILFKNDPIGINFASNTDEYERKRRRFCRDWRPVIQWKMCCPWFIKNLATGLRRR
jgi:hypothetical protein